MTVQKQKTPGISGTPPEKSARLNPEQTTDGKQQRTAAVLASSSRGLGQTKTRMQAQYRFFLVRFKLFGGGEATATAARLNQSEPTRLQAAGQTSKPIRPPPLPSRKNPAEKSGTKPSVAHDPTRSETLSARPPFPVGSRLHAWLRTVPWAARGRRRSRPPCRFPADSEGRKACLWTQAVFRHHRAGARSPSQS